jgi:hypothetical protein
MDELVPHPCDVRPGDVGGSSPETGGQPFRGLTDTLDLADHAVLDEGEGKELLLGHGVEVRANPKGGILMWIRLIESSRSALMDHPGLGIEASGPGLVNFLFPNVSYETSPQ